MADTEHPLFGAEVRADRAIRHIAEFNEVLQRWVEAHPDALMVNPEPDGSFDLLKREEPSLPDDLLPVASAIIGDTIYNLRASLDYVVYALAVLGNKGEHVSGTQFPIEDDPSTFEGRVTGKHPITKNRVSQTLRKVPPAAVDMIRKLQPFAGSEWTKLLQSLSNPDKHTALTGLHSKAEFTFNPSAVEVREGQLYARGDFAVQVFFLGTEDVPEALDVPDTLEFLERCVRLTIKAFKPFFD